jgi:hypothetical protein
VFPRRRLSKKDRHTQRKRSIPPQLVYFISRVSEYWIVRWSLLSGAHSHNPVADDDDWMWLSDSAKPEFCKLFRPKIERAQVTSGAQRTRGVFVRHDVRPVYISAALAYGWQDITTNHAEWHLPPRGRDRLPGAARRNDAITSKVGQQNNSLRPVVGLSRFDGLRQSQWKNSVIWVWMTPVADGTQMELQLKVMLLH